MKKRLKNSQMIEMVRSLQPLLSHRDRIGYMAARNYRTLTESLTEYETFKKSLIEKYGEAEVTEDGQETGNILLRVGSPNFKTFCDEMAPFNEMEHEVELMIGKYDDVIGDLTGSEILSIDWMLED